MSVVVISAQPPKQPWTNSLIPPVFFFINQKKKRIYPKQPWTNFFIPLIFFFDKSKKKKLSQAALDKFLDSCFSDSPLLFFFLGDQLRFCVRIFALPLE